LVGHKGPLFVVKEGSALRLHGLKLLQEGTAPCNDWGGTARGIGVAVITDAPSVDAAQLSLVDCNVSCPKGEVGILVHGPKSVPNHRARGHHWPGECHKQGVWKGGQCIRWSECVYQRLPLC
jgi:hypothetical protein